MELKLPPHSTDAETALLAAVLERNSLIDDLEDILSAEYFYRRENQIIFGRMVALSLMSQPIDPATLVSDLDAEGELDQAGGVEYIADIATCGRGAHNAKNYAQIVRDRWLQRQLIAKGHRIAELGYDAPKAQEAIQEAQALIMDFDHSPAGEVTDLNQQLRAMIDKIDDLMKNRGQIIGLPTGLSDLDKRLSGLQSGDLVIVAGRPSMGKTTLAMNFAERAALDGKNALIFSLEMPAQQLLMRSSCSIGKFSHDKLRRGELDDHELSGLTSAVARLKGKSLSIDDRPALTSEQALSRARKAVRKSGKPLDLIVVDYIQLMSDKGEELARITNITRNLKLLAKSMDCPVVALSQLNRECDKRPNKRPLMSDLRSSGSIEQDADVIMFVYRDEVYNTNSDQKGIAEVNVAKFRNGEIGTVFLASRLDQCRFDNLSNYTPPSQPTKRSRGGFDYE